MLRKILCLVVGTFIYSSAVFAQGSISGTVTDSQTGETLPGVNILIQELQRGAATDTDGAYTISNIEAGTYTLRATFVGYRAYTRQIEVAAGEQVTHDIALVPDVVGLDDVVVTAQGIQREQRALGYSVSSVSADALESQGESDITRVLSGKVPGVNITQTSGVTGTATDFVVRGYSTISGSNQPLFIVDGVRFNSSNNNNESFVDGGALASTSRFLDLDPNNIESVNVLKGLSAATIYGEEGRNGVVLITTKNGTFDEDREPGFDVTINQSIFITQIASLPDYQDSYGGGFHQNFGYFFSNWGPAFDSPELPNTAGFMGFDDEGFAQFPHPYSQFSNPDLRAAFPEFQGEPFSYKPYDNVGDFFRDGTKSQTSLNISGGTQAANINLSVNRSDEEGFTPGNDLVRNNVGLGLNFNVSDRITVKTTANVALTDMRTPPVASSFGSSANTGGGGSVFGDVFYTPRSIDLNGLPFENPVDGSSVYYRSGNDIQNPRWTVANIKRTDETDRLFGKTEVLVDITDEITFTYKLGLDTYSQEQDYLRNAGGVNNPDLVGGYMHTQTIQQDIWDHNVFVNFNYQLNEEFSLDGLIGGQLVIDKFTRNGNSSTDQIVFGLFNHSNFQTPSSSNELNGARFNFVQRREQAGAFFDATVGYNDWVYLNLSGRNDWFSTLETDNRTIFYPSASLSVIPTDVVDIGGDFINYIKVRGGVGTSAGAPSPYNTRSSLASNARAFLGDDGVITTNAVSNSLGNPNLEAERHTEFELGIESKLFKNRIGLDVTVYKRITEDLITSADLDPATGFTNTLVNIGEIENRGLEISASGTPVTGEFTWNTRWNFFTYVSEVNDLGQDLSEIAVAGFTNLGNFAIEGQPLNIMQGSRILRDEQGRRVVNSGGDYIFDGEIGIIGDPNPDYTLSAINTFNYKNFALTAQVDFRQGGDVYSTTVGSLLARGITTDTDFDRQVPVVLPGVNEDGEPNDVQITATQAFFTNIGFGPDEVNVFDGTNVRLSELSLSYNVPTSLLAQTPYLKQVSFTLSGFNLWYFTPFIPEGTNFDPNVSGTGADNGLGFDFLAGPSARRFGGSVKVLF